MKDPRWNLYGTFFQVYVETHPIYGTNILVGIMLYPNETGCWNAFPEGSGLIASITFRAIKQERGLEKPPLTCYLTLNETLIIDEETRSVSHIVEHGLYIMYPTHIGDFNYDGKVDIRDVAGVASAFGSYPGHPRWDPIYDTNNDESIDIRDVAVTASGFGWAPTVDP